MSLSNRSAVKKFLLENIGRHRPHLAHKKRSVDSSVYEDCDAVLHRHLMNVVLQQPTVGKRIVPLEKMPSNLKMKG